MKSYHRLKFLAPELKKKRARLYFYSYIALVTSKHRQIPSFFWIGGGGETVPRAIYNLCLIVKTTL
jgi:hypothetical protein